MSHLLCLDGGRSGCRARLRAPSGRASDAGGPPLPYHDGSAKGILEALDATLAGLPRVQVATVVAGLAGVFEDAALTEHVAERLAQRTGAGRVVVTGDLVTAHAGALRLEPGAVIAAGTGAVAFAVGPDGSTARADGWGYLLGDEGGGFWIGRAALAAALAHRDGRGGSAELAARAEQRFGSLDRLPGLVYSGGAPVGTVAAFAPDVAAAARAGDPLAAGLWAAAGRHLAVTVSAAAQRVLGRQPAAVSWTGGLFKAGDLLLAPLRAELARRAPQLELQAPAGGALDGAELLAGVDPLPTALGHVHRQ